MCFTERAAHETGPKLLQVVDELASVRVRRRVPEGEAPARAGVERRGDPRLVGGKAGERVVQTGDRGARFEGAVGSILVQHHNAQRDDGRVAEAE